MWPGIRRDFVPRTLFGQDRLAPFRCRSCGTGTKKRTAMALDLFDAFGTKEKTLHANMGGHTGVAVRGGTPGTGSWRGT
jgi:hypothetical protein